MCDNDQECNPVVPGTITPEPLPNPEGGGGTSDFNQLQNRPKYGGVEMSGSTDIPNIEGLIPTAASSSNQLADKDFVNSSVATNTAYFVGTFDTIEELEAVENPSNNDYGFVIATDSAGNTVYNRYKFNSDTNTWVFEYALNNSSFTADQWAAIQSGITSQGVDKLEALALIESVGEGLNLDANGELSFDKNLIGRARVLTTADYSYGTAIRPWLLEPGLYYIPNDTPLSVEYGAQQGSSQRATNHLFLVGPTTTPSFAKWVMLFENNYASVRLFKYTSLQGAGTVIWLGQPVNTLTSTTVSAALSANQGKVLKDLIDSLVIRGAGAPTTSTVGEVGQLYEDGTNGALYQLKSIDITVTPNTYNWEEVGGSNAVLYTDVAGQNTDGAPTQKAVHDEIYGTSSPYRNGISIGMPPTSTTNHGIRIALRTPGQTDSVVGAYGVAIGINTKATTTAGNTPSTAVGMFSQATGDFAGAFAGGNASGVRAIAIGAGSTASGSRAIAIGSNSTATLQGEINIGNGTATTLYNGSGYRLLTGLYDPQNAHDAATKGYVDTQVGNINTALQTLLNGTGA